MSTINGRSHKAVRFFREQAAALAVYWVYCARRNSEGVAWCSIPGLIKDSGWSQNPVREGRAWLIEHGALERVFNYVRPEWRKLTDEARMRRRNRDRAEYYRVTGVLVIEGATYPMLYAPADDAEAEVENRVSQNDTLPENPEGRVSPDDVSQNDTLIRESPGDMSPGDSELITNPELVPTGVFELDTTTTSGAEPAEGEETQEVVVVVDETDQRAWDAAFSQLQMQLDTATFEAWLRGAVLQQVERDGEQTTFVIAVRNSYAQEALQHRLYRNVRRVLSDVSGSTKELRFEVDKLPDAVGNAGDEELPLFRQLAQEAGVQSTDALSVRALFEQHIGAVTDSHTEALALLEDYGTEAVSYAFTVMAGAQARGRVRDPLGYTLGILRKLETQA